MGERMRICPAKRAFRMKSRSTSPRTVQMIRATCTQLTSAITERDDPQAGFTAPPTMSSIAGNAVVIRSVEAHQRIPRTNLAGPIAPTTPTTTPTITATLFDGPIASRFARREEARQGDRGQESRYCLPGPRQRRAIQTASSNGWCPGEKAQATGGNGKDDGCDRGPPHVAAMAISISARFIPLLRSADWQNERRQVA